MSDSYLPDNGPRDILLSLEELAAKKLPHAPTFRKAADEITRLRADLAAVTAERDRMREALEFYGWAEHWVKQPYERSVIEDDKGRRARAALEGVAPASPWRDIESAPKNGTPILAFARGRIDCKDGAKILASTRGHIDYYGVAEWAEADPNLNRPKGVWIWDFLIRPTHWMPLPEPPR